MGSLYKQPSSRIWWAKYYVNGRPVRESTGTPNEEEAKRFLRVREGQAAAGQPVLPRADRIRYDEAAADLRAHYQATGSRDVEEAEFRLAHLDRFFGGWRLVAIDQAAVRRYILRRQAAGAANGTINRELAVLIRMFRLAYEGGKLFRLPVIRKVKEAPPRQGFFEPAAFEAVRRELRPDLRVAVALAYALGWRTQSEVLPLALRQVDLQSGTIRLDPGQAKNEEGRLVYLPADLKALVAAQAAEVRALERKLGRIIPHLFPHLRGRHRGERIRDFRRAWQGACRRAKVGPRLRHDFRRTAVRNLVDSGVPERVAMEVTGHKTRSVFDRYHIVSPADLQEAARRLTGIVSGIRGGKRARGRR
ncbi:MAG: site-specific integrase [Candidatus Rokuibacteriota bacterium]|nr:MAG: site-specific integrase [Candidatus Rokubacteria bacterium]